MFALFAPAMDGRIRSIAMRSPRCHSPLVSTITLSLPDEDLAFLRKLSKEEGTSAEELLARQARNFRRVMEAPLPAAVAAATGIIAADLDVETEMAEHLGRKHL